MSQVDRVSLVASQLEQRILSGDLSPGDLLPPEREICKQLGVSRSVVREALGRLASVGLIRSQHGSGTRVEVPSSKPVTQGFERLLKLGAYTLEQLATVRMPLEAAMTRLAATNRTDQDLLRMVDCQQILSDADSDLEVLVRADVEFHAALADASGNPIFAMVLAPIQELLIESRRRTLGRDGAAVAWQHHERILAAVRNEDPDEAETAMCEHIAMTAEEGSELRRRLAGEES